MVYRFATDRTRAGGQLNERAGNHKEEQTL